ncbi:chalcone isomerase family protein [Thiolapillus sp.]
MRWLILTGMILWSAVTVARTVEGVNLPETISLDGEELVLNGAGVREKFFFDIYVAALYLPAKTGDAGKILAADQPWRMTMNFLYSEVGRKKLDKGWDEGFEANVPPAQLSALRERLQQFKNLFTTMHKGDVVVMDYQPGKGVRVTIRGEEKGTIPGADFAAALLSVWIGAEPVTGSVKKALLGG